MRLLSTGVRLISSLRYKKDDVGMPDVPVPPSASQMSTPLTIKCDTSDIKTSLEKTELFLANYDMPCRGSVMKAPAKRRKGTDKRGECGNEDFHRPDCRVMVTHGVMMMNKRRLCC